MGGGVDADVVDAAASAGANACDVGGVGVGEWYNGGEGVVKVTGELEEVVWLWFWGILCVDVVSVGGVDCGLEVAGKDEVRWVVGGVIFGHVGGDLFACGVMEGLSAVGGLVRVGRPARLVAVGSEDDGGGFVGKVEGVAKQAALEWVFCVVGADVVGDARCGGGVVGDYVDLVVVVEGVA